METIENKKIESKTLTVSKNTIICGLVIALVLMTAAAIGLAVSREEGHGEEGHSQSMMRDDNNTNPNDGEVQDDQQPAASTAVSNNSAAPAVPVPSATAVQAH